MDLRSYVVDLIEGKRGSRGSRALLLSLSHLFSSGVALRNFAFDRRWLRVQKVSIPVVSVGNIVAGGTGKTPLIAKLGRTLSAKGRISILSRGYRSRAGRRSFAMRAPLLKAYGDEASLLFNALPEVHFFVGRDRVLGAKRAVDCGTDLILLDDGMQYRRLHRDLEIVMLYAPDPYGRGYFLPRGYLRDFPSRIASADAIFLHSVRDSEHFHEVAKGLSHLSIPLIGTRMRPLHIALSAGGSIDSLAGLRVGAFCGLGNPPSFFAALEEMGGALLETWRLPDHSAPGLEELLHFAKRCKKRGCDLLVCSEKDRVKLPPSLSLPLSWGELRAELEIVEGKGHYDALIEKMESWISIDGKRD